MHYPEEWDKNWVSMEDFLKLTETVLVGGYVAYNSKGEVGFRILYHVPQWMKDADRELKFKHGEIFRGSQRN